MTEGDAAGELLSETEGGRARDGALKSFLGLSGTNCFAAVAELRWTVMLDPDSGAVDTTLPEKQVPEAYSDALKIVFVVMCALAGVAMVASAWTKGLSLDRALGKVDEGAQGMARRSGERDEEKR